MRSQHQNGGRWIRRDRRLAIYLRDDFRCLVCRRDLRNKPGELTLDHVMPRSRGGHHERNLYTCCRSCNSQRQDKPLAVFVRRVAEQAFPQMSNVAAVMADARLAEIRRNRRRKLDSYRRVARELLKGGCTVAVALERKD